MARETSPSISTWPALSRTARVAISLIAAILWLTNRTVRPCVRRDILHLAQAFLLEIGIADRQHLVDDEDLRLQDAPRPQTPAAHTCR